MKHSQTKPSSLTHALIADLFKSFSLWRYWSYRSLVNYRLKFQGTVLGLIWPTLSLGLVVIVLGTLWGIILQRENPLAYYLYLIAGYPIWQVISATINVANRGLSNLAQNNHLPFTMIIFERIAFVFLGFLFVFPAVSICVLFLAEGYSHLIYLPLALISLLAWSLGVLFIVSVLVTLKPDIRQMISAMMRLAFLATPIIWEPTRLGSYIDYIWINPFFAPLEFARYAISGILYMPNVVWIAPIYSLLLLIIGLVLFSRLQIALKFKAA